MVRATSTKPMHRDCFGDLGVLASRMTSRLDSAAHLDDTSPERLQLCDAESTDAGARQILMNEMDDCVDMFHLLMHDLDPSWR